MIQRELRLAGRFALLIGILLAAISCNKFWTSSEATWAADGIRVQLRPRALRHGADVGRVLECISRHSNGSYASAGPEDENVNEVGVGNPCQIDLLESPYSPFIGVIHIGQPEQEFEVLVDTGSDVLWVASEKCTSNGAPFGETKTIVRTYMNLFRPQESLTFHPVLPARQLSITYVNGFTFSGPIVRDVVRFGKKGSKASRMSVPDQEFALISSIDHKEGDQFPRDFDGVMGLRAPVEGSGANLIGGLLRHKLVHEPLFTLNVHHVGPKIIRQQPSSAPSSSSVGELVFGSIDRDRYVGQIAWVPVTRFPKWQVRIERIEVLEQRSGRTLAVACEFGCNAVVDTGTNYVTGPKYQADALNRALGFELADRLKVWWSADCLKSERARKIALVFHMAGQKFVLNEYAVVFDYEGIQERNCVSMVWPDKKFSSDAKSPGYWILGAPFIEKFYSIFDYGQRRVGFAIKADL